jgi:hypothetical protein
MFGIRRREFIILLGGGAQIGGQPWQLIQMTFRGFLNASSPCDVPQDPCRVLAASIC